MCPFSLSGTVIITRSPQTVSNATLGGRVRFECGASGTTETPGWNINGQDYRITDLPIGYVYNGASKSLVVSPVENTMNNSVYYCYFLIYSTSQQRFVEITSSEAMLIIQPSNFIISKFLKNISIIITINPQKNFLFCIHALQEVLGSFHNM